MFSILSTARDTASVTLEWCSSSGTQTPSSSWPLQSSSLTLTCTVPTSSLRGRWSWMTLLKTCEVLCCAQHFLHTKHCCAAEFQCQIFSVQWLCLLENNIFESNSIMFDATYTPGIWCVFKNPRSSCCWTDIIHPFKVFTLDCGVTILAHTDCCLLLCLILFI